MNARISLFPATLACTAVFGASLRADWKDDVGYTQLQAWLGASTPDGAGVPVTQVEANEAALPNYAYLANPAVGEFSGKTITDGSLLSTGNSGHASNVGRVLYGNSSSIAPGVTDVLGFEVNDWIDNQLNLVAGTDPAIETGLVQNHSWVGDASTPAANLEILQRFDFQVDRDDFLASVGLNNGVGNPQPLLSNSYNALSVGLSNGNHSASLTTVNGPGRTTPSIVAPGLHPTAGNRATSWAAGMVSSAAALLHEAGSGTNAARSEALRAILLAGATKDDVGGSWSHTSTQPLDAVYGAGELNVFNSYGILAGGEQEGAVNAQPGSASAAFGWDYEAGIAAPATSTRYYDFDVPLGQTATELSVILAWNAEVSDGNPGPAFDPSTALANMDLAFYDSTASFLDTMLAESVSTIDNIEHIYLTNLDAGSYTLALNSDTDRDFGLAWRLHLAAVPVPEPSSPLLLIIAGGLLAGRRRR